MTIGQRIKYCREQKNLTQTELADRIGTTKQNLYKYENGIITNIPSDKIELMAVVLEVSPAYLMGWDNESIKTYKLIRSLSDSDHTSTQEKEKDKAIDRMLAASRTFDPNSMIPVPIVGNVAAGYTCLAETDIESYALVDSETLLSGYEYMWLRVQGASMEPLLLEGDLVLVRLQDAVENGDYAVVIVDEEDGLVKEVKLDKDAITLISKNPYYPPRQFTGEDVKRVRIVGKVIESKRLF